MTAPRSTETPETPLTRDLVHAARYYLGGRRGLLVLAGLAIVAGLALNWSWLAAAGIAPILVSVLPCLAMCAFGLCMHWGSGKSCSAAARAPDPAEPDHVATDMRAVGGMTGQTSEMMEAAKAVQFENRDGSRRPDQLGRDISPETVDEFATNR